VPRRDSDSAAALADERSRVLSSRSQGAVDNGRSDDDGREDVTGREPALPSADDGVCARDGVAEMRADEAEPCSDDFSVLSSCCSRRISASFFNDSTCERSFAISAS
jgi:hypothetical protein